MPGRIRSIKPEFYTDIVLINLPDEVRLAFPGIWIQADREGRLEDKPDQLRVDIFPDQDRNMEDILQRLEGSKLIIRYQVNGKRYIQVTNFLEHQRPNNREAPSVIIPLEGMYAELHLVEMSRINARKNLPALPSYAESTIEMEVLSTLNKLTGATWEVGRTYGNNLRARISEGKTLDDLLAVMNMKVDEWKGDPKMQSYLTPKTLFRPENFERYLVELKQQKSGRAHDRKRINDAWEGQQEGEVDI